MNLQTERIFIKILDFRFWILDCGSKTKVLAVPNLRQSKIQNLKSKSPNYSGSASVGVSKTKVAADPNLRQSKIQNLKSKIPKSLWQCLSRGLWQPVTRDQSDRIDQEGDCGCSVGQVCRRTPARHHSRELRRQQRRGSTDHSTSDVG